MNKPRMLIVDDTPENIRSLMEFFRDECSIMVATDGEMALQLAQASPPPDILLLDVRMPGIDGYEVCTSLKSRPETRGIPIIFITGLSEEADEQKGLSLGAVDFITRPFNPSLVRARVQNHLELKRHRDHLENLVQQRTSALMEINVRLHELSGRLIGAQEEERKNIARNLHDELGQRLTAVGLEIACLEKTLPDGERVLAGLHDMLKSLNASLQRIYQGLRPVTLDKLGLVAAAEGLIAEHRTGSKLNIVSQIKIHEQSLPAEVKINIFRILQEALNNVVKHAQAKNVRIILGETDEELFLRLEDDGRGCRPPEPGQRQGFGLLGMRERANLCQGSLEVSSSQGQGTQVVMRIPHRTTSKGAKA